MSRHVGCRNPQDKLYPAAGCQQTEFHRFCGQRYDGFGRVACPARETSRRPEPATPSWPSVDTGLWLLVVEKSERPLVAERDEQRPCLVRPTGHTRLDRPPVGHRRGAAIS